MRTLDHVPGALFLAVVRFRDPGSELPLERVRGPYIRAGHARRALAKITHPSSGLEVLDAHVVTSGAIEWHAVDSAPPTDPVPGVDEALEEVSA